ncbi:hypothetical protein DW2_10224 [Thioclava atlantica]|uniref:Uncharacterized protein n=1 Tax=Thioclava atlantica TaxID=1317124 RepID=A0A085TW37_9RHOB|nr:hypothetical protein DW2_10224 [Thioclava atlantica]
MPLTRAIEDDDIVVAPNALESPALWRDPALSDATFLNGEVVAAMRENGTAKFWNLKRCRVLRLN